MPCLFHYESGAVVAQREDSLLRADASISDVVSQSFRNPLGDEHDFLLTAAFGFSQDHPDAIDVSGRELQHLTDPHPRPGLKFQNESVPDLSGSIDDLIHGLPIDYGPDSYSRRAKHPFDDGTVTRVGEVELIAFAGMVEKSSKVSTPAVSGALFSGIGYGSKKGKGLLGGNGVNSSLSEFSCEPTEHKLVAGDGVFFPSLPGGIPRRLSPLLRLA